MKSLTNYIKESLQPINEAKYWGRKCEDDVEVFYNIIKAINDSDTPNLAIEVAKNHNADVEKQIENLFNPFKSIEKDIVEINTGASDEIWDVVNNYCTCDNEDSMKDYKNDIREALNIRNNQHVWVMVDHKGGYMDIVFKNKQAYDKIDKFMPNFDYCCDC